MKSAIVTLLVVTLAGVLVMGYFYTGKYNIAATERHTTLVHWFLSNVQMNSIRMHAKGIEPPELEEQSRIDTGLSHYHQMCVTCHGAPGIEASEIGKGLNPEPPDLTEPVGEFSDGELFWTLKNGIKMTGMPAYGPTHDDRSLWGIVAFLKHLPSLSEAEYRQMVVQAGLNSSSAAQMHAGGEGQKREESEHQHGTDH